MTTDYRYTPRFDRFLDNLRREDPQAAMKARDHITHCKQLASNLGKLTGLFGATSSPPEPVLRQYEQTCEFERAKARQQAGATTPEAPQKDSVGQRRHYTTYST